MAKPPKPMCLRCGESRSQEMHHVYPVEFGGAMHGPKVPLCGTCHTEIHRLADQIAKGDGSLTDIEDSVTSDLVTAINQQRTVFAATQEAPDARRRIVASLTKDQQQAAHFVKSSLGLPSLEAMMKALIMREAVNQGYVPNMEDDE